MNPRKKLRKKDPTIIPWYKYNTWDFAITPPFEKCIIPDCYFTYVRNETLDFHIMEMHPELKEYYDNQK